jgi:hypothetical protein
MESNFRNRDFEEYVKQNADQYRMFPSEKVWKGIHGSLHTRRKWYGFGLALLLLSTVTAVTWVMVSYPVSKSQPITSVISPNNTPNTETANAQEASNTENLPFSIKQVIPTTKRNSSAVEFPNSTSIASINNNDETIIGTGLSPDASSQKSQLTTTVTAPRIGTNYQRNNTPTIATIDPPYIAQVPVTDNHTELYPDATADDQSTAANQPVKLSQQHPDQYPLTIESVLNYRRPRKKLDIQIYVTPTISYRQLTVNKSLENAGGLVPMGMTTVLSNMSDVNSYVTHKPDFGVQVGVSGGYSIAKNVKVRAGVQFNINRYDIKASLNNLTPAPFDLTTPGGDVQRDIAWTYLRTNGGVKTEWLKNYYFSVSMPIGIEMKLFGKDKTNFGIAGTVQPTYIIKDRAYMISTDYKNYATVPTLTRKVNVSTGFEMFVNYESGNTRWQIGPQVRYQILSSFHNKYPVKENLFDFGLKMGVSLNQ